MSASAKSRSSEAPSSWLPWLLVLLVAFVGFGLGRSLPRLSPAPEHGAEHAGEAGEAGEAAEIWTCSMHPQIQQPEPGACPICGMDLIPLGDLQGSGDQVTLSDRAMTLARIQTVEVERIATPGMDLRLLGRVEVDESRVRNVSAWISGRVDKLAVRETGTQVRRGQIIASLYSPEVYAAHQDLLTAAKQVTKLANASDVARNAAEATLASARERLSLLGLSNAEIDRMAAAKSPSRAVSITASDGGTIMERLVTQGQYVEAGAVLYRIADLSKVWVQLDAYESDLPGLLEGQSVEIEVEALPGERFTGAIAFIDPLVDPRRRVARVRVEVANPNGQLRPGMFVEAIVRGSGPEPSEAKQKPLVVPATAPLFTGKRSLVYVEGPPTEDGKPSYAPREVELGPRMGEFYPVVAGLALGERVVVHGAFAIDADLQIRGGPSMMSHGETQAAGQGDQPNMAEVPAMRVEPSAALRKQLAAVVAAYLDMQVTLADDDWIASQAAAQKLLVASRAVEIDPQNKGGGKGQAEAKEAWALLLPTFETHAEQAAKSTAIEGARGAFLHLSLAVEQLVSIFGNPLETALRQAYCPMAAANAGAAWFQLGDAIDNSYFGESMLSCGEFRSTIEPGQYLLRSQAGGGHGR